jgi:hypothetical protein
MAVYSAHRTAPLHRDDSVELLLRRVARGDQYVEVARDSNQPPNPVLRSAHPLGEYGEEPIMRYPSNESSIGITVTHQPLQTPESVRQGPPGLNCLFAGVVGKIG